MSDSPQTIDAETTALLDRLCVYFAEEIERQETVLALCLAQGDAARAMNVDLLEQRTEALAILIVEAATAEATRVEIFRGLTHRLAKDDQSWTLGELIALSPEPWSRRMAEFQARLNEVVAQSKRAVESNAAVMRRSLRITGESVDRVLGPASAAAYTEAGGIPQIERRSAAVLNMQG